MTADDPLEALRNLREYLANQSGTQPIAWLDAATAAVEKERAEFLRHRLQRAKLYEAKESELAALRAEVLKVAEEMGRAFLACSNASVPTGYTKLDPTPAEVSSWAARLRKACE